MAWTAPRTWVTSELVTSSIMNTHVRDNLDILKITPVTALPGSPIDEQLVLLTDSMTVPTYQWLLMHDASISAASKWRFLGGAPLFAEIATDETVGASGAEDGLYVNATTPGPAVALPVAGSYDVEISCRPRQAAENSDISMSYAIGGTAAVDADAIEFHAGDSLGSSTTVAANYARTRRKTGLTAVTLTAKYKASTGSGSGRSSARPVDTRDPGPSSAS